MGIYNPLEKFGLKKVSAAFSSRQDGNMSLSYGPTKHSLDNRKRFLSALGIDYRDLICAKQVHGKNFAYVGHKDKASGAFEYGSSISDTDGFITDEKDLPVAILTADCLSVFIFYPESPAIAILHSGLSST